MTEYAALTLISEKLIILISKQTMVITILVLKMMFNSKKKTTKNPKDILLWNGMMLLN